MNEDHTRKCFEFSNGVKKYYLDTIPRCGSSAIVLCADMLCLPLFVVLCPKDIGPDLLTFTWNCSYPAQKMSLHAKSLLHLWKVILAYFVLTITCKWVNQNCTRPLVLNSLIQFAGTSSILPAPIFLLKETRLPPSEAEKAVAMLSERSLHI